MSQLNIFGEDTSKKDLLKEIKEFNKEAKKFGVEVKDKLLDKKEELTVKEFKKLQETFETAKKELADAKDKKAKEEAEKAKELQESKDYLTKEGISFEGKKDSEINSLAKETAKMPKYPFKVRLYGDDVQDQFNFENGKRYKLDEVKAIVVEKNFELKKAEFEYDKERNSIYISMSSSKKG